MLLVGKLQNDLGQISVDHEQLKNEMEVITQERPNRLELAMRKLSKQFAKS